MHKKYYLLLILLAIVGFTLVGILVSRAQQADQFFEYQKEQETKRIGEESFEAN